MAQIVSKIDIRSKEFADNRVLLRCYLPRHLVRHIQEPDVQIRLLDGNGQMDVHHETEKLSSEEMKER